MMNHAEGKRTIRTWSNLEPEIRMARTVCPSQINHDDLCFIVTLCFLSSSPEGIPVTRSSPTPKDDATRIGSNYGKDPPPQKCVPHHARGAITDLSSSNMIWRSQDIEKSLSYLIMGSARSAGRGNGLRSILIDDFSQLRTDFCKSFIPWNDMPPILPPFSYALHWVIQPRRMIKILNHCSSSRAPLRNRIGRPCSRKFRVRINRDKTITVHGCCKSTGIVALDANDLLGFHTGS